MRREIFRMSRVEALQLIDRAPFVHLSTTSPEGAPIYRALDGAIAGGRIVFHGSPVGEKTLAIGREAVISAVEMVAHLPSWFSDPERACPATTMYRSVQVHGVIERIEEPAAKAEALAALLARLQPEGGHAPMDHTSRLYAKELAGLLVIGVSLEQLDGKAKLGQHKGAAQRGGWVSALWQRGAPGDLRAIDLLLATSPDTPLGAPLTLPEGARIGCAPTSDDAGQVARLLAGTYWNDRFSAEELAAAHLGSSAWLVARDPAGDVIASARALSDGHKRAWIYDVIVAEPWRGRDLGDALMRALLDHPALRRARIVQLATRDAMSFYERMGFRPSSSLPPRPYTSVEMTLER